MNFLFYSKSVPSLRMTKSLVFHSRTIIRFSRSQRLFYHFIKSHLPFQLLSKNVKLPLTWLILSFALMVLGSMKSNITFLVAILRLKNVFFGKNRDIIVK